MRLLLLVVLVAGCSKPSENCSRSVKHILSLMDGPPGSKPSAAEQATIDQVAKVSIERCSDEGLSDAQRDCILSATALTERSFLMCPALVAKKPSWLMAPIGHPEVLDELDKLRNETPEP